MSPRRVEIRTRNDDFQLLETLKRNRKKRAQSGLFVVEGVRPIDEMHAAGWPVDSYVFAADAALSGWASGILARSSANRHFSLSRELLAEISDRDETSELLAIARLPERGRGLDAIPLGDPALVVVADRPASPGNLGTLIRSCDALAADGLAVVGRAADIFDPRSVRASTGSLFRVPVVAVDSPIAIRRWIDALRAARPDLQVVGSSASGACDPVDVDWCAPTLLMIGNERTGLSRSLTELCGPIAAIPMTGSASSLNVSVAASILLYAAGLRRRTGDPTTNRLPALDTSL